MTFFRRKNQRFVIKIIVFLQPLPENKSAGGSDLRLISQEPPLTMQSHGGGTISGRKSSITAEGLVGTSAGEISPYAFRYILSQNPRNTVVRGFRKFIVAAAQSGFIYNSDYIHGAYGNYTWLRMNYNYTLGTDVICKCHLITYICLIKLHGDNVAFISRTCSTFTALCDCYFKSIMRLF